VILILIRDRDSVPQCLCASVRTIATGARASARFDVEQHQARGMTRHSRSSTLKRRERRGPSRNGSVPSDWESKGSHGDRKTWMRNP